MTRDGKLPRGGLSPLAKLPPGCEDNQAVIDPAIETRRFSAISGSSFGAPGCVRFGCAGMSLDGLERLRAGLGEVLEAVVSVPARDS